MIIISDHLYKNFCELDERISSALKFLEDIVNEINKYRKD